MAVSSCSLAARYASTASTVSPYLRSAARMAARRSCTASSRSGLNSARSPVLAHGLGEVLDLVEGVLELVGSSSTARGRCRAISSIAWREAPQLPERAAGAPAVASCTCSSSVKSFSWCERMASSFSSSSCSPGLQREGLDLAAPRTRAGRRGAAARARRSRACASLSRSEASERYSSWKRAARLLGAPVPVQRGGGAARRRAGSGARAGRARRTAATRTPRGPRGSPGWTG